jgi:two-component system response regulator CpxR
MANDERATGGEPAERPIAVLLVDDDIELCELMREFFASRGLDLETAGDGTRGLARALRGPFDLVLLDVMMPGLDGFEVLRQVRRQSPVPVIMLTARAAQADRVAGLDAGADDYLPKPFGPEELLARIRAVLRRAERPRGAAPEAIEAGGVRLLPAAREARAGDDPLALTTAEFDILEFLLRHAGRTVSRDELTAALYHRRASPFDRALDVHISNLRRKLGARGGRIVTVRGVGYLFQVEAGDRPGGA